MRLLTAALMPLCFFLFVSSAQADLFGDFLNKAKQTAEELVNESLSADEEQKPAAQPAPKTSKKPVAPSTPGHDPVLVRQIQAGLNQLGYPAGKPDGLYGPGTRKAIEAFQKSQGMVVDGQPSEALLQSLQSAQVAAADQPKASAATSLPEPTPAAAMLAAVHFRPYLLDDEFTLKRVLLTVHPELQSVASNEFQWHKRKAELKEQLLQEAKSAQLSFELQPWRESSFSKGRPVELLKYDFSRQAFQVQVLTKMLIFGGGEPAEKYAQQITWFAIDPDTAEKIDSYFGGKQRRTYLHYRYKAVGALIEASRPTPVIEFENDQLDLYALESTPQGNKMHTEYKYLATVQMPTDASPAPVTSVSQPVVSSSVSGDGVVKNAEIDGVKLGMQIEDALQQLKEHGYDMKSPSQHNNLTGVKIEGRGKTADGAGWIEVLIYHMNGTVYRYQKSVGYLLDRLPAGSTASGLEQKYRSDYLALVAGARYSYTEPNGRMNFDDNSPPPYNRQITSPHARITLFSAKKTGRLVANFELEWKELVGVKW